MDCEAHNLIHWTHIVIFISGVLLCIVMDVGRSRLFSKLDRSINQPRKIVIDIKENKLDGG